MANTTPLNDGFAQVLEDYSKDQTDLYTALLGYKSYNGIVNPYTLYNNQDRFLNLSMRYRPFVIDGQNWWRRNMNDQLNPPLIEDNLKEAYGARTDLLAQYLWSSTGVLGVAYSVMTQPGILGKASSASEYETKRDFSEIEWGISITRSTINAVIETGLIYANYLRYLPVVTGNANQLVNQAGNPPGNPPGNPLGSSLGSNPLGESDIELGDFSGSGNAQISSPSQNPGAPQTGSPSQNPGAPQISSPSQNPGAPQTGSPSQNPGAPQIGSPSLILDGSQSGSPSQNPGAPPTSSSSIPKPVFDDGDDDEKTSAPIRFHSSPRRNANAPVQQAAQEELVDQDDAIHDALEAKRETRALASGWASAGFAVNAMLGVGMASARLVKIYDNPHSTWNERAIGITGLSAITFNMFANVAKSRSGFLGSQGLADSANAYGQIGSVLGIINGAMNIASASIAVDDAHGQARDVLLSAAILQGIFGLTQIGANGLLAQRIAQGATTNAELFAPLGLAAMAGFLGSLNVAEIYGMAMQSAYADELDKLGAEMTKYGYSGDFYLADLYRDKVGADAKIFAATTLIALTTISWQAMTLASPMAPVASIAGMVFTTLSSVFKGLEQSSFLDDFIADYRGKIEAAGGAQVFFSADMQANYKRMLADPNIQAQIAQIQTDYGVGSVVSVSSIKLSPTARELAAITRYGEEIKTAAMYGDRFVAGKLVPDKMITLEQNDGTIDLTQAAPSQTNPSNSQVLKFLTPLMIPGDEIRDRDSNGKASHYTSLTINMPGTGWTISDGVMDTIFDMRNVVTGMYAANRNGDYDILKYSVPLNINGGAGNDMVFAGASNTNFDGGAGSDAMSYQGLSALSSIVVSSADATKTDSAFTVNKTLINSEVYKEVIGSKTYSYGKDSETVEYRDVKLDTTGIQTAVDTLTNVEIISGSTGNDSFAGNAGANIFSADDGADTLNGMAGDDVLTGGEGNDTLNGGAGNDAALYNDKPDAKVGIYAVLEDAQQPANPEKIDGLALIYGHVQEKWTPALGQNGTYTDQSTDQLISIENLLGTDFDDALYGSRAANVITGGAGIDIVEGYAGADILFGGADNDALDGGTDDDTLEGGDGNDQLKGGDGNDYFLQNNGGVAQNFDVIDGGSGTDLVDYYPNAKINRNNPVNAIDADLATGKIHKDLDPLTRQFASVDTVSNIENVCGTTFDDRISGNASDNLFLGMEGNDSLQGLTGDDYLDGGAGNDTLSGGTGDDHLAGASGNDALMGGSGNDTLLGGEGVDTLRGGDGLDLAAFSDASGLARYGVWATLGRPATPADPVEIPGSAVFGHWTSNGDFIPAAGMHADLYQIESMKGTDFTDRLVGNDDGNLLDGIEGEDRIEGKGGNDVLIGGEGADAIDGGDGDDLFFQHLDAVDDTLDGGAGEDNVDYSGELFTNGVRAGVPDGLGVAADLEAGRIDKFSITTVSGLSGVDFVSNIENVTGSVLNDTLLGDANSNALFGNSGDDAIDGRDGADLLDGGGGNDVLIAGAGNDTLYSGEGSDSLSGNTGNDVFLQDREVKSDTLDGGDGVDTVSYISATFTAAQIAAMQGLGIAADLASGRIDKFHLLDPLEPAPYDLVRQIENIVGSVLNDSIQGDDKNNQLEGSDGNDTLIGGTGDDTLAGGSGADSLTGNAGNDIIVLDAGSGNDTLDGGDELDTLDYSQIVYLDPLRSLGIVADLALGTVWKSPTDLSRDVDTVANIEVVLGTFLDDSLLGDQNSNHLVGHEGDDTLDGRAGDDFLEGSTGNDSIKGAAGNDTLSADAGNDSLDAGDGDDTISQHLLRENDVIDGGAGVDSVYYNITKFATGMRPGVGTVGINADLVSGRIDKFQTGSADGYDTVSNVENVTGTIFNDTITGDGGMNYLEGDSGNDSLFGGGGDDILGGSAGNDILDGGNGDDFLAGGPGNDTMRGAAGSDYYEILDNSGADVVTDFSRTPDAGDVIEFKDGVVSGELWFTRLANDLKIVVLGTVSSVTVMNWFVGSDYQLESIRAADGKQLTNTQVATLVTVMAPFAIPASSADVPAAVNAAINASWTAPPAAGSNASAEISNGSGANLMMPQRSMRDQTPLSWALSGNSDDNYFSSQAGNDSLDGAEGNDTIYGGAGNDVLSGSVGDDNLSGESGNDQLSGGAGNDILLGDAGADLIDGGAGNDAILQEFERRIETLNGGDGIDLVSYSSAANTTASRAGLGLDGIHADLATGRIDKFELGANDAFDLVSNIENVIGSSLNDSISGDAGNNFIAGGAGHDALDGRDGNDTLYGGAGNDTLTGAGGNDLLDGQSGNDLIRQLLVRSNDTITGGGALDVLDYSTSLPVSGMREGMALIGITGNLKTGRFDKFEIGAALGYDTVKDIDMVIGSHFDDAITGDWFDNTLAGAAGNDTLRGAAGSDVLDGGAGDDVLDGGDDADLVMGAEGNDRIVQNLARVRDTIDGGAGIDSVDYGQTQFTDVVANSSATPDKPSPGKRGWLGNLGISADLAHGRIDKFEAGGRDSYDSVSGIENIIGSILDDAIVGDAQANLLDGAAGNDKLSGGGGNDTLLGGAGDDRIVADDLNGNDSIDGGAGLDTVDYSKALAAGFSIVVDRAAGTVLKYQHGALVGTDSLSNIEVVIGSPISDTLAGSGVGDVFYGDGGNDVLEGLGGDDTLNGGAGNDSLAGGAGNDALVQDNASGSGSDTIDGGIGTDTLDYSELLTPGASIAVNLADASVTRYVNGVSVGRDSLRNIEHLIATTYGDSITGSVNGDLLDGNAGNDTLTGGAGNDAIFGGRGNDLIVQDGLTASDKIDGGQGFDTVDYSAAQASVAGAGVTVDFKLGSVSKYSNGAVTGTDALVDIEGVIGSRYNDTIAGSLLGDFIDGNLGDDSLNGDAGNDTFNGGAGNDLVFGGSGDDIISQFDADKNDTRYADTLDGGAGVDTVDYSQVDSFMRLNVDLATGYVTKFIYSSYWGSAQSWSSDIAVNIENIIGTKNADSMSGSSDADSLDGGDGADTLSGAAGSDTLRGGAGADLLAGEDGDDVLDGGGYSDTLSGGAGNDFVSGGADADLLSGGDGNDVLNGDAGNDTLNGNAGNDAVSGGEGDDLIIQSYLNGRANLDGGSGSDTLDYSKLEAAGASIDAELAAATVLYGQLGSSGVSIVADLGAATVLKYLDGVAIASDKVANIEVLIGTRNSDRLSGSVHAESLYGGAGNDTLNGAGGNDAVMADEGDDTIAQSILTGNATLDGGSGNDLLDYGTALAAGASVRVNAANQTVSKYLNGVLVGTDSYLNIEAIAGSRNADMFIGRATADVADGGAGNDTLDGGAGSDLLHGGAGDDVLIGGSGFDYLNGGEGDDLIIVASWDSLDAFDGGAGTDTLDFSKLGYAGARVAVDLGRGIIGKFSNAGTVYNGDYAAVNLENIIGTQNNDDITGNASANILISGAGNDVVNGGAGNDSVNGGAGDDLLAGGHGNDVIGADAGNDTLTGEAGDDLLNGGIGNDSLNGGTGNDSILGAEGNDLIVQMTLAGSDSIIGGSGTDTLDYSQVQLSAEASWGIDVQLAGGVIFKNTLNAEQDTVATIEVLIGTQYNDFMRAGEAAATLIGGAGIDRLTGGGGNDSLQGGEGNDMLFQDRLGGNDTLDGGNGADAADYGQILADGASIRVDLDQGSVTKMVNGETQARDTLRNIESVIGSRYADVLRGTAGSDTLSGGAGNDTLAGNLGNDALMGGEGDDQVSADSFNGNDTMDGGNGVDMVDYSYLPASATINANLAAATVIKYQAGIAAGTDTLRNIEIVIGTNGSDTLAGGIIAEMFQGGGGNDSLKGSAGNDTLDGGSGMDTLDYSGLLLPAGVGAGIDANLAAGSVRKRAVGAGASNDTVRNIEHLTATRFNDTLVGNDDANVLVGGDGNDVISGGAGDDTVMQDVWRNNDTLDGGAGRDTLDYSTAQVGAGMSGGIHANLALGLIKKNENGGLVATDVVSNIERIVATRFNDTLVGDANDNVFLAGDGNDAIVGAAGNDVLMLELWRNNDTFDGGDGMDMADYSGAQPAAGVTGGLHARLMSGQIQKFENGVLVATDAVSNVEGITGTAFNDTIGGNASANVLIGGAGDDMILESNAFDKNCTIDGGSGIDTLDYRHVMLTADVASISYNLAEGWVKKYLNGVLVGTDTIRNIENVESALYRGIIVGSDEANLIKGNDGPDLILANAGDDTIAQSVWRDSDVIDGGAEFDTVDYTLAQSAPGVLNSGDAGGLNANLASGRIQKFENGQIVGTDTISGIEHLVGSQYKDTIAGSSGVDRTLTDHLDGGEGDDVLISSRKPTWAKVYARDTLSGGGGNDTLYSALGTQVSGGTGDDLVFVESNLADAIVDGGAGSDTVDLSSSRFYRFGHPQMQAAYGLNIALTNGAYTGTNLSLINIENIVGTIFNDSLTGDNNANLLAGGAGNDHLNGAAGNDSLIGGVGSDNIAGSSGDDRLLQDVLVGNDTLDGGLGVDVVDYTQAVSTGGAIKANFATGSVAKYQAGTVIGTDVISNLEGIIGSQANDTITGSNNAELIGGSLGSDVLDGGAGIDTVDYSLAATAGFKVRVDASAGTVAKYQDGVLLGSDTLSNIELLIASQFDDEMIGSNQADTLDGNAGRDTLTGGAGNDVINGAQGDDHIMQTSWSGDDNIDGGAGNDTVDYSRANLNDTTLTVDLAAGTVSKDENGYMVNTDTLRNIEGVIGGRLNDAMSGSASADTLDGGLGDDTVNGAAGADLVAGGKGNDSLNGGSGNDLISGGDGDDLIMQANWNDSDTLNGGNGTDRVDYSSAQWTPSVKAGINANLRDGRIGKIISGAEVGVDAVSNIEAVIASRFNDTLVGDVNDNFLTGGDGHDVITGVEGNDTILQTVWRNNDSIDGGDGTDTLDYSAVQLATGVAGALNASLVNGLFKKFEKGVLVATDLTSNIDNIIGTLYNDTMLGNGLSNFFSGGAGDDTLDAADGADTLDGGAGNDVLKGGSGNDHLLQMQLSGNDTMDGGAGNDIADYSGLLFKAPGNIGIRVSLLNVAKAEKFDNWTVMGTDSLSNVEAVIGSTLADTLSGNHDANLFIGGTGNDTMFGFNGNDTLNGGEGRDKLDGGTGADLIEAGTGDDLIIQDLLVAVGDTIDGGEGVDTLDYSQTSLSQGTRTAVGQVGINADLGAGWINKFQAGLSIGIDTVSQIENLIGTVFNDTLSGNALENVLDAGGGDDWLTGGGANDTLQGGAGNDHYHFDANFGDVTVRDVSGARDVVEIVTAAPEDFIAARSGLDLKLWHSGTYANVLTIADWYSGAGFQIEEFRIGNSLITGSDMNLLVTSTPASLAQLPRTQL